MATLEPVPDAPAATARIGDERTLVVADYHAGIEVALAIERGIEIESRADQRRERLVELVERTVPDRLLVLGDLMHSIGDPGGRERDEIEALVEALPDVPITLVKGNHDGAIEDWVPRVEVTDGTGVRLGEFGFAHGHTWPAPEVVEADVVCVGHEHPQVRLADEVGGSRVERIWLRGPMAREPFVERDPDLEWSTPELVVLPAFNELAGGTWVNVEGQEFLAPFLPAGLASGEAFLLDGTRLGDYRSV
ncbi:metallophosphoesterase [Salinarchaeum chitinilyticum]